MEEQMAYIQHIDDLTEDQFYGLTRVQQGLLYELMHNEVGFGFWFYDEWATAIHEDHEGSEAFWQIDIELSWTEARDLVYKVYRNVYELTSCGCSHDCCGHSFLSGVNTAKMYEREDGYQSYIIRESWGVNI
jgi:hypothetical protein